MSLVPVFTDIKAQLLAKVAKVAPFNQAITEANTLDYVQMWNNQLASWRDSFKNVGDDQMVTGNNNTYVPPMPALLIEFDNLKNTELGAGVQLYEDLVIRIHIVHQMLDANDGTMEQNLEVYALADQVYAALNKFKPAGCVELVRQAHRLDSAHDNMYHYIVEFGTNYVDASQLEPVGGKTATINKVQLDLVDGDGELTDENENPVTDENDNPILTS